MIVMPLGVYEDMMDEDNFEAMGMEIPDEFVSVTNDAAQDVLEIPWDQTEETQGDANLAKNKEKVTVRPVEDQSSEETESEPGISLEERFYFEPLEDGGKK